MDTKYLLKISITCWIIVFEFFFESNASFLSYTFYYIQKTIDSITINKKTPDAIKRHSKLTGDFWGALVFSIAAAQYKIVTEIKLSKENCL